MVDKEKQAHDLALLYMLMEIKNEQIVQTIEDSTDNFTNEYRSLYKKFLTHLESQR